MHFIPQNNTVRQILWSVSFYRWSSRDLEGLRHLLSLLSVLYRPALGSLSFCVCVCVCVSVWCILQHKYPSIQILPKNQHIVLKKKAEQLWTIHQGQRLDLVVVQGGLATGLARAGKAAWDWHGVKGEGKEDRTQTLTGIFVARGMQQETRLLFNGSCSWQWEG